MLGDVLFTLGVEIYTAHTTFLLVEADVVEALETGAVDSPDAVIGDEKMFFPPHKYVLPLGKVRYRDGPFAHLLSVRPERRELAPVAEVDLLRRAPGVVFRDETVLASDDLAFEIGRQGRIVFCQA